MALYRTSFLFCKNNFQTQSKQIAPRFFSLSFFNPGGKTAAL